ncbi:MAG TPA: GNAT family N-acetyltransferase, partial [Firmicutes bacterium]|nr:GNAT family N-acetyltransferase [Bacillota bacterium]
PCFWGHGYAKEAARAVISFAFDTLEISSLFAGHHPGNDASHRLLIQLGFCYVGDEYYPPTGLNHPSYILIASDFNNSIK